MGRKGVAHRNRCGWRHGTAQLQVMAAKGDGANPLGGVAVGFTHLSRVVDGSTRIFRLDRRPQLDLDGSGCSHLKRFGRSGGRWFRVAGRRLFER
jgi:hypothetical protein